jgi:hypothetical protein
MRDGACKGNPWYSACADARFWCFYAQTHDHRRSQIRPADGNRVYLVDHVQERAGRTPRWERCLRAFAAAFVLCPVLTSPSFALDGHLDADNTVQAGRAGGEAYRQRTRRSEAAAEQRVVLDRSADLRFDGRLLRELYNGKISGIETDFQRRSEEMALHLDYRRSRARFGLSGTGFNRRNSGSGIEDRRVERRQLGTSADLTRLAIRASLNALFTDSRRQNTSGPDSRNREWVGSLNARSDIPRLGELGYRFSAQLSRDLTTKTSGDQTNHTVILSGDTRFAASRGQASWKTNSSVFLDREKRTVTSAGDVLRLPFAAGFLIDDTPETHDPLESELTSVPTLFDRARDVATIINLGDSAPAAREFGGDYRNILFDFGEAVPLTSAILYLDRTLLGSELFRWRIFVSNDPQGRLWQELGPEAASTVYREWGTGLQGWAVSLNEPVSARFLKMVDVKLGPTVPDLFVTELETNLGEDATSTTDRTRTTSHRVGASLGYALTPTIQMGYSLSLRRRSYSGRAGTLQEGNHALSTSWNRGVWSVAGHYQMSKLNRPQKGSYEVNDQSVLLQRGRGSPLLLNLSWSRERDRGSGLNRRSSSMAFGADWRAAPALRLHQQVSYGRLSDYADPGTSASMVVMTSADGAPFSAMTVGLQRTDRWVSREAGAGFTRFNDTSAIIGLRPLPLISLESQVRYEARDRGEWITRNTVSWTPLPGGTIKMLLHASHYRETRAQLTQREAGTQIDWAATPVLTLRGNVETVALEQAGQKNSPLNVGLSGIWRF